MVVVEEEERMMELELEPVVVAEEAEHKPEKLLEPGHKPGVVPERI